MLVFLGILSLLVFLREHPSLVLVQKVLDASLHLVVAVKIRREFLKLHPVIFLDVHLVNDHFHLDSGVRSETRGRNELDGPGVDLDHDVLEIGHTQGAILFSELLVRFFCEVG